MEQLAKNKTGIKGLDIILNGGLLSGRGLLLIGGPGTGKTILLSEFIHQGITLLHQNGVFVSFEERPQDIIKNLKSFGWDWENLIKKNKLIFVDASPNINFEEISGNYNLTPLLERIKYALTKVKARRLVIDGFGNLFQKFSNKRIIREVVFAISDELKRIGILYMISTEKSQHPDNYSVEEYVSDGVIELTREEYQGNVTRGIEIIKLRGASHLHGKTTFEINNNGLAIFPKVQIEKIKSYIKTNQRYKFGVPAVDEALGGGLPEGSVTVIVGGVGTGKTTLSTQFLAEGLKKNQNGICISFKDSFESVEKISERLGWHFDTYMKHGKLSIITLREHPDKLIYTLISEIEKIKAKRAVIDSIDFIDPITTFPNKTVEFYVTLIHWLKIKGVTCILNCPTDENGLIENTNASLRRVLNALPDGIIVMRNVEVKGTVRKKLNILKMRHNDHRKEFFTYEVDQKGFHLYKDINQLTAKKEISNMKAK